MSNAIHNPALSTIEDKSKNSATLVIEPMQAGYGNTLGNSLRRVLLSSIEGGALVAFRIEGATHEFTTVKGIKEDVVDIMLNLKNVHLKVHTDQPVELRLEKKGAGVVTAGDIKTTADVEVVNPEQIIATIDDPNTEFKMDIVVESGRGYQTIEESTTKRIHSDMIAIDGVFSPVRRVRYAVEKTRVGDNVDLDKLTLTIDTDGTITPVDAFEQAGDAECIRPIAIQGRKQMPQDVVSAPVFIHAFQGEDIAMAFHHAELGVFPLRRTTQGAGVFLCEHAADGAGGVAFHGVLDGC